MKKATEYGEKVAKALPGLKREYKGETPPEGLNPLQLFVLAVLRQNASLPTALAAMETLDEEFVDFNEMRVAPIKDIVELLKPEMADARDKAVQITTGLNRIFDHDNRLDFEHVADMGKRDLRAHLREALGFTGFVEAYLMLYHFGAKDMPVDAGLVERMKADDLAHPESTDEDVRALLQRVIPSKDQPEAFELLACYAAERIEAEPEPEEAATASDAKKKTASKKASAKSAKTKAASTKTGAKKSATKKNSASKAKTAKPKTAKKKTKT